MENLEVNGTVEATMDALVDAGVVTLEKPKRTRAKNGPSDEVFLAAWNEATTVDDVVAKTGMNLAAVNVRACVYRKRGKELKKLQRRTRKRVAPVDNSVQV